MIFFCAKDANRRAIELPANSVKITLHRRRTYFQGSLDTNFQWLEFQKINEFFDILSQKVEMKDVKKFLTIFIGGP